MQDFFYYSSMQQEMCSYSLSSYHLTVLSYVCRCVFEMLPRAACIHSIKVIKCAVLPHKHISLFVLFVAGCYTMINSTFVNKPCGRQAGNLSQL